MVAALSRVAFNKSRARGRAKISSLRGLGQANKQHGALFSEIVAPTRMFQKRLACENSATPWQPEGNWRTSFCRVRWENTQSR